MLLKILRIGFTSCRTDGFKLAPATAYLSQMLISQIPHDGVIYSLLYPVFCIFSFTGPGLFQLRTESKKEGIKYMKHGKPLFILLTALLALQAVMLPASAEYTGPN